MPLMTSDGYRVLQDLSHAEHSKFEGRTRLQSGSKSQFGSCHESAWPKLLHGTAEGLLGVFFLTGNTPSFGAFVYVSAGALKVEVDCCRPSLLSALRESVS